MKLSHTVKQVWGFSISGYHPLLHPLLPMLPFVFLPGHHWHGQIGNGPNQGQVHDPTRSLGHGTRGTRRGLGEGPRWVETAGMLVASVEQTPLQYLLSCSLRRIMKP
jgi:hypothetical protein